MVRVPPLGMASRALTARLMRTCSIMPGSAWMAGRSGGGSAFEVDVFAQQARSILARLLDDLVEVESCGCIICLRLNMSNWRVRLAARSAAMAICRTDSAEPCGRGPACAQQQAGMALDDGQDVVEIVGHAGGQLADRLHLLGLAQLGFEVEALGDVFGVAMHHLIGRDGEE